MDWTYLFTALGMMLILEGIVPFIRPTKWKQVLVLIAQFDDFRLRIASFILMMAGLAIIYIARSFA